jgi:cellulose synthase/poly-beta-1,6-N-acetylglucosamine synthase-like glycosyltransferase
MEYVFWICLIALYYIYDGYFRILKILHFFMPQYSELYKKGYPLPQVTVLVTVFNEIDIIQNRIENIQKCDYPIHLVEILVASDGSTDGTDDIVAAMPGTNIKLFRPNRRIGKTDTQNQAIAVATGEIIIFTDADTSFDKHFLHNMVKYFSDPNVGGVDGHLLFITEKASGVSQAQGYYWNSELNLRQLESRLGFLAVASGACMAIRRQLFKNMEAAYGEDCIVPLDIVSQGYRMVHASDAIAYDRMEYNPRKEFKARVRMTLRNVQGTLSRKSLLNPLRNPGYAFSLWSHKLLRWLSPLFLIVATVICFMESNQRWTFSIISTLFAVAYGMGVLGWLAERFHWRIPMVRIVFSFFLVNCGFLVGLLKAALGHGITAYRHES